jgi:hypothetical protein
VTMPERPLCCTLTIPASRKTVEDRMHSAGIQARLTRDSRPAEPGSSGGQCAQHSNISLSSEQLVEGRSQRILGSGGWSSERAVR